MSLISISDVDEEGTSLALLGEVRLRSAGSTNCTDELCRVDSHVMSPLRCPPLCPPSPSP